MPNARGKIGIKAPRCLIVDYSLENDLKKRIFRILKQGRRKNKSSLLKKQRPRINKARRRKIIWLYLLVCLSICTLGTWTYFSFKSFPQVFGGDLSSLCCKLPSNLQVVIKPDSLDQKLRMQIETLIHLESKNYVGSSSTFLEKMSQKISQIDQSIFETTVARIGVNSFQIFVTPLNSDLAIGGTKKIYCYDIGHKVIFGDCSSSIIGPQYFGFLEEYIEDPKMSTFEKIPLEITENIAQAQKLYKLCRPKFGEVKYLSFSKDRGHSITFQNNPLKVLFGFGSFSKKIDRLSKVLSGLTADEKQQALSIELDFEDKAFIKKESVSEEKTSSNKTEKPLKG